MRKHSTAEYPDENLGKADAENAKPAMQTLFSKQGSLVVLSDNPAEEAKATRKREFGRELTTYSGLNESVVTVEVSLPARSALAKAPPLALQENLGLFCWPKRGALVSQSR